MRLGLVRKETNHSKFRRWIYFSGVIFLSFSMTLTPAFSSVATKGKGCSNKKVEQIVKSGASYLICKKVGGKYLWNVSSMKAYKEYKSRVAEIELARLNAEAEAKQKAQAAKDLELELAAKDLEEAQATKRYIENQPERDSISKGAGYRCTIGKFCSVGNVGTGGGIVFLGSGIAGDGKHYEIAPKDWLTGAGDPELMYCIAKDGIKTIGGFVFNGTNEPILQYPGRPGYVYINNRIGDGKNNTKIIIERCKESAASKASSYQGGGYRDWFLPSAAELMAAYTVREKIVDMQPKPYWSSSEFYSGGKGKVLVFDNAGENQDLPIGTTALVRPVRNF
jgi:hypothetical protein